MKDAWCCRSTIEVASCTGRPFAMRPAPGGTSATEYRDILGAVDFQQGVDLAAALQTKRPNVEFGQGVTPDEIHEIHLTFPQLVDTYNDGAQFLLDHL